MQDGARIRVVGGRRLRSTLKRAGLDMTQLRNLHMEIAKMITPTAQHTAPYRSGQLQGTVRAGATRTAAIIRAGNNTAVPYAGVIHWGWPARGIQPRPWLSHAAQNTEAAWVERYQTEIERIISKVEGA